MNELKQLETPGPVLPSASYLMGAILFGILGYTCRRGRDKSRRVLTWTGLALMLYPYAMPQTWLLWLIGAALCA